MPAKSRKRTRIALAPRKTPLQARSQRMREDLLQAAARVLARDGARLFTTNRVAAVAGASVGSLYRIFPTRPRS